MGCFNDELLFIHIPKCGGWAAKKYLHDHVPGMVFPKNPYPLHGSEDWPITEKLPIGHVPLRDIERFTGRAPSDFATILAVVRSPYAQQLSQWAFWRDRYARGGRHPHDSIASLYPTLELFLEDPRCDFHVWYETQYGGEPVVHATDRQRYEVAGGFYLYWLSVDGAIPKNVTIIRQEELDTAFPAAVAAHTQNGAPMTMERLNTSPHGAVHTYYSPRAAQLVEQKFTWAFENYYDRWLYSSYGTQ